MKLRAWFIVIALIAAGCGGSGVGSNGASEESNDDGGDRQAAADGSSDGSDETVEAETPEAETTEPQPSGDTETADSETEPEPEAVDAAVEGEPIAAPTSLDPDCSVVPSSSIGLQSGTITSGGLEYAFQFVVPSSYDGSSPAPMVLDFHGLGSNGAQQAIFSGVAALAETEGFVAVQPTGIPVAGEDRNSWELPQFDEAGRDDVQMVLDLIDFISENVCIDPGRIYSMGMSNGSLFTSELICDLSERIAAGVSVAGVSHDDSCNPTRAVPYLAFHGIDDLTVPFNGGGESSLGPSPFFEQVMPEEFSQFADDFGCTGSQDSSVTAEITLTSYEGCDDDVEMGFYAISGAGHTWPGSPASVLAVSLGVTNTDIDATAVAWEFFQRNSLPGAIDVVGG